MEIDLVINFSLELPPKPNAIKHRNQPKRKRPTVNMASDRCRKKFVGTKYEQELNDLYKNDLISTTSTPTEAFNASPLFQLEGWERDKFNNHFYAWRTRILQKEEEQRTKGRNPPTGTFLIDPLLSNSSGNVF